MYYKVCLSHLDDSFSFKQIMTYFHVIQITSGGSITIYVDVSLDTLISCNLLFILITNVSYQSKDIQMGTEVLLEIVFKCMICRSCSQNGKLKILTDKPIGKRRLGTPRRRWEDNVRVDLKEIDVSTRNCIDSVQDRDYWRVLVNAILDLRVP